MDANTITLDRDKNKRYLELQKQRIAIQRQKLLLAQENEKELEESPETETATQTAKPQLQNESEAMLTAYPMHDFVREGFAALEQGRQFRDNWHISIICLALQATVTLDIRNLIINIPRRCMKSLLACVLFPSYVWTFLPEMRFLYTSYSQEFAGRDNKKTLDLIDTDWYQNLFGEKFKIGKGQVRQERKKITNNKGGFRVVFKIGKGTGEGGDYVFADDPNAIEEVESDQILKKTNQGWSEVSAHNVTDRSRARRVIIQQRTDPDDLTGFLTADEQLKKLYKVLCLAMKYESDNPLANTPENPLSLGFVNEYEVGENPRLKLGEEKLWIDPRDKNAPDFPNAWYQEWYRENFIEKGLTSKGDGQLLWEDYLTEEVVAQDVAHLKAHGEHSQFQQRPVKRGGNFFNSDNFQEIEESRIPKQGLILSRIWDKAGTDGAGDWTVGMLIARTKARPFFYYILDMWFGQVSYHERMEKMKELATQDVADYITPYENEEDDELTNEYFVTIEKEGNSSGSDVALLEKEELGDDFEIRFVNPRVNKAIRAKPVKLLSEQGRIKVKKSALWLGRFFSRLTKYDPNKKKAKDDEIDTLSHGIKILRNAGSEDANSQPSSGVL